MNLFIKKVEHLSNILAGEFKEEKVSNNRRRSRSRSPRKPRSRSKDRKRSRSRERKRKSKRYTNSLRNNHQGLEKERR